jgi:orotate phosphoribosyltransferase
VTLTGQLLGLTPEGLQSLWSDISRSLDEDPTGNRLSRLQKALIGRRLPRKKLRPLGPAVEDEVLGAWCRSLVGQTLRVYSRRDRAEKTGLVCRAEPSPYRRGARIWFESDEQPLYVRYDPERWPGWSQRGSWQNARLVRLWGTVKGRNMVELVKIIREHSLRVGSFRGRSGRVSPYYVDLSRTLLHVEGVHRVAKEVVAMLAEYPEVRSIGGLSPSSGVDHLVGATLGLAYTRAYRRLTGFALRRAPRRRISDGPDGALWVNKPGGGTHVLFLDDVTTDGVRLKCCHDRMRDEGLVVDLMLSIVDRREGAPELLHPLGINYRWLVSGDDILERFS